MGKNHITTLWTGHKTRKKNSALSNFVVAATVGGIMASLGVVGAFAIMAFYLALGAFANGILLYILNFGLAKAFAITMFPFVKDIYAGLSLTILFRLVSALRGPRV